MKQKHSPDFSDINTWVFDLDNTLYPSSCNLFAQVDVRMTDYICSLLNISRESACQIQKNFYRDYGTTLRGLMNCYQVDPDEFLDHVHNIDYSWLAPNPALAAAIACLDGRKLIFTNGSRRHAENVLKQLGLDRIFDKIFDIKDADYIPKPEHAPYRQFLRDYDIMPQHAVMFEDLAYNLQAPKALGMRTVLVVPEHQTLPQNDHVDFVTSNLRVFLQNLTVA